MRSRVGQCRAGGGCGAVAPGLSTCTRGNDTSSCDLPDMRSNKAKPLISWTPGDTASKSKFNSCKHGNEEEQKDRTKEGEKKGGDKRRVYRKAKKTRLANHGFGWLQHSNHMARGLVQKHSGHLHITGTSRKGLKTVVSGPHL